MNLLIKLVSSPWFWLDVILSVWGGILVWRGLKIEKNAEKLLPPDDFKPDIFGDIIEKYKSEMERGWKILMRGIVIEVVAALGISIISGLEIADLTDKSEHANLAAKQAEEDSAKANERAAVLEKTNAILFTIGERARESAANATEAAEKAAADRLSIERQVEEFRQTNLVLQTTVLELEAKNQDRKIAQEQMVKFLISLGDSARGKPVWMCVRHPDRETTAYYRQVAGLLTVIGGATIAGSLNLPDNLVIFNNNSSIAVLVDSLSDAPPYATNLFNALNFSGLNPTFVTNSPTRYYSPSEGHPDANQVFVLVGEKP
jgi:hypothetical protein